MKERRRSPRTNADLVLEVYDPEGHLVTGVGRVWDLSAKGAKFQTNLRLQVGQRAQIVVRLEDQSRHELPAKVVWARGKGTSSAYGLEFLDVPAGEINELKNWLKVQRA